MSENQALLDAFRVIVDEAVAPLPAKIDGLVERIDSLAERVDALAQRMDDSSEHSHKVEMRLTPIEDRVGRLEEIVERLELRMGQVSRELFDLQDRMERGFASIMSETTLALKDIGAIKQTQQADQKKFRLLEKKVTALEQRLGALEHAQAAPPQ